MLCGSNDAVLRCATKFDLCAILVCVKRLIKLEREYRMVIFKMLNTSAQLKVLALNVCECLSCGLYFAFEYILAR